jgi:tetratricopeptide (TPR) repeat protein
VFERRGAYLPAALTLFHLGAIHRDRGRLEESIACTERSAELLRRLDNPRIQVAVIRSLGEAHRLAGFDDARPLLEKTITIAQELGDRFGESEVRHALGDLHRAHTRFADAAVCLTQSLETFREFNAHNATAAALLSLGRLRHATDEYDQAGSLFDECLRIARQHQFPLVEARAQLSVAALLESRGNKNEVDTAYRQAQILFRQRNLPELSETDGHPVFTPARFGIHAAGETSLKFAFATFRTSGMT